MEQIAWNQTVNNNNRSENDNYENENDKNENDKQGTFFPWLQPVVVTHLS